MKDQEEIEDDDVAICAWCVEQSIDPPALGEQNLDGEWLCNYHAEQWARGEANSAEAEADRWYDQEHEK